MCVLLLALNMLLAVAPIAPNVSVIACLPDGLVRELDGLRLLRCASGVSRERVRLRPVGWSGAVLEIAGQHQRVEPDHALGEADQTAGPTVVRIGPDDQGRYTVAGRINGLAVGFLVDTGSPLVALNAAQAVRLGVDFRRIGTRMGLSAASGHAVAYRLRLDRVQVGGIQLLDVPAMVIDGAQPAIPLLGMSFLGRLRLHHEGSLLILEPVH